MRNVWKNYRKHINETLYHEKYPSKEKINWEYNIPTNLKRRYNKI